MTDPAKPSLQDLEARIQTMSDPAEGEEVQEAEAEVQADAEPEQIESSEEPQGEPAVEESEPEEVQQQQLQQNPLTSDLVEAFKAQAEVAKAQLDWQREQVARAEQQRLAQAQQAQESDEWIANEMGRIGLDPTNAHHVFMFQTARQQQKIQAAYDSKIQHLENQFRAREAQAQSQAAAQQISETAKDAHPLVRSVLEQQVKTLVEQGVPAAQAIQAVMSQPLLQALTQLQPNAAKKPALKVAPQSQDPKRLAAMKAVAPQGKTAGRAQPRSAEMSREQRLERMKAFERGEFPR